MDIESVDPVMLTLYGEENVTVNYGSSYIDEGAYAVFNGEDCSAEINIVNHVDTSNLGNYTIEYSYKDKTIIRNVTVADTSPPAIELLGSKDVFLAVGDSYAEPGYTAADNYDGDITTSVKLESNVDASAEGEYSVIYTAEDSSGNSASAERKVKVVSSPLTQDIAEFSLEGLFEGTIIPETILTEEQIAAYVNDTVVVGDSRAGAFRTFGLFPDENVWSATSIHPINVFSRTLSDSVTGGTDYLVNMLKKYKPVRVIFSMGIDSVGANSPEFIAEKYKEVILRCMEASPDTKYIVHSIMPVDGERDMPGIDAWLPDNKKINDANYCIALVCKELGIHFIDSSSELKDEEGHGISEYFIDDLVHLTYDGQRLIYEYIVSHPLMD
ncbi:MAG: DUF5011 domain-containing protein [Clostridia bacterium]|nr:DUF5011 domain-containing protein [Clostridia bacterium]